MTEKLTPKTVITISVSDQHPGKLVFALCEPWDEVEGDVMPRAMTKKEILTELGERL